MKHLSFIIGCLFLISLTPIAHAQTLDTIGIDACKVQYQDAMHREWTQFRSVLYGTDAAEDANIGTVQYDETGQAWIKTQQDLWKTLGSQAGRIRTNASMDTENFPQRRRGLFFQKKELTSNITPAIAEATRAFHCRLRAVCEVLTVSQGENVTLPITVQPAGCTCFTTFTEGVNPEELTADGCIALSYEHFPSCSFENTSAIIDAQDAETACTSDIQEIFSHETDLLQLSTAYDASYRMLLQFGGVFESFLLNTRVTLFSPLTQILSLLERFATIPCFQAECSE